MALADLERSSDVQAQAELALRQANHLVTDRFPCAAAAAERAVGLAHAIAWHEGEVMAWRMRRRPHPAGALR